LISILYQSTKSTNVSAGDIYHPARINNAQFGITGCLLETSELYFQYIEGPAENVRNLMANISVDPRHSDVNILHQVYISSRLFEIWNMGYFNVTDEISNRSQVCDPNSPIFVQTLLEIMTSLTDTS